MTGSFEIKIADERTQVEAFLHDQRSEIVRHPEHGDILREQILAAD